MMGFVFVLGKYVQKKKTLKENNDVGDNLKNI